MDDSQSIMNFDEIEKKFNDSTVTVDELRLSIFAPVEKFNGNSATSKMLKEKKKIIRKTNWGEITIERTMLSQVHRDLLDCVLSYGEQISVKDKNSIAFKFSVNEILEKYSGKKGSRNTKWVTERLTDMMSSVISIKTTGGNFYKFQILSNLAYSEELQSYYLEFNPSYTKFFAESLTINYKDTLEEILEIKEPIIKAIVRLSLTHKSVFNMKVYDSSKDAGKSGLLEAIGYPIESPAMRARAFNLLRDNVDVLKKFGVYYNIKDKNSIKYSKKDSLSVSFVPKVTYQTVLPSGANNLSKIVKQDVLEIQELSLLDKLVGKPFEYRNSKRIITGYVKENEITFIESYDVNDSNQKIGRLPFKNQSDQEIFDLLSQFILK
ncbi:MAG: hypothetical protein IE909_03560 [Campylobacterales bacterium]|nr:hypothetical protein [Campylobacterales bacterium]